MIKSRIKSAIAAALTVILAVVPMFSVNAAAKKGKTTDSTLIASGSQPAKEATVFEGIYFDEADGKEVFRNDIPLKKSLKKRKEKQEKE